MLEGVYLTAYKDETGCLVVARADREPSHRSPAVKIQPSPNAGNPGAGRAMGSSLVGKGWFKLFEHPAQSHRAFDTADTLEKAEAKLLAAARWEAAADLNSVSVEEARKILGNRIDRWLERKRSEGG